MDLRSEARGAVCIAVTAVAWASLPAVAAVVGAAVVKPLYCIRRIACLLAQQAGFVDAGLRHLPDATPFVIPQVMIRGITQLQQGGDNQLLNGDLSDRFPVFGPHAVKASRQIPAPDDWVANRAL